VTALSDKPFAVYRHDRALVDLHIIYHPPTDRKEWYEEALASAVSQRCNIYCFFGITGDIARARHAAFQAGDLPLVGWLDPDDRLLPDAIGRSVAALAARPGVVSTYGNLWRIDEGGARLEIWEKPDWTPLAQLLQPWAVLHPHIARRAAVLRHIDAMLAYPVREEHYLFGAMTADGDHYRVPGKPLAEFRVRAAGPASGGQLADGAAQAACVAALAPVLMAAHRAGRRQR
jgi:hypothetical protein